MCLNPACWDHLPPLPLASPSFLHFPFPFFASLGGFLTARLDLFFSHGCLSVCSYFSPSLSSLVLSCVFLSLYWSPCFYFYLFQRVSFSVCLCLSLCITSSLFLSPPPPPTPLSQSLYLCAFLAFTFSPPACPGLPAPGLPPPPPVQGNVCGAIVLGDI